MNKILFFLLSLLSISVCSQDYFQQKVDYTIDVTLNDKTHELTGNETFVYSNNSPETLSFIYIHLWPNAYKDNTTALVKQQVGNGNWKLYQAPDEDRGYIDLLDFKIDGKPATWELDKDNIDICKLFLNEPLAPGKSITVSTPFHVKIPSARFSRLGHVEDSYQITQWYPKPAVFDKDGWHQMPYLNQGEFYSEFGTFEVKITLPKNYIVGATGDLQEQSEINFLNKQAEETQKWLDENPKFTSDNRPSNDFPESSSEIKTITFKQKDVHDFAWFADKRYKVLKGEVELPHSKRKVTTWNMFTPRYAEAWRGSLEYIHDATYYYSLWNGDYLYNHVTAVDGTISAGGGMEYPNITVIGSTNRKFQLEVVIMHEVGHNWFYGMLGSNERDHTWMDEGLNSFNEQRYIDTKYPDKDILKSMTGMPIKTKKMTYSELDQLMYKFTSRMYIDQPMETKADEFSSMNYGMIAYKKSAVVFNYLKSYLGDDLFDECMQRYFDRWKTKHPQPEDLEAIFTEVTKKDLSWFFNDMIKTTNIVDYKILNSKYSDEYFDVEVKNAGQIKAPFSVNVIHKDSIIATYWIEGIHVGIKTAVHVKGEKGDVIRIDALHQMPEFYRHNNTLKTKGIFKKIEPIRAKLATRLDGDENSNLFWTPIVGWNNYNKWMVGVNLNNSPLPSRSFEYSFSPMYSFATKNLNGFANISYSKRNYEWGIKAQKFNLRNPTHSNKIQTNYVKANPYVKLKNIGGEGNDLIFSSTYLLNFHRSKVEEKNIVSSSERVINKIEYQYNKKSLFSSFRAKITAKQFLDVYVKTYDTYPISFVANYSHYYGMKKKKIKLRGFAGKMFRPTNNISAISWSTGGNKNADFDYEHLYLGRNETQGILSKQITDFHGGLRMWFGDYSNNVLVSGLVAFELPTKIPLEIFAGTAYSTLYQRPQDSYLLAHQKANYNVGITLDAKFVKVHVPLLYSQPTSSSKINILEAISFEFNIEDLNPKKILKNNIR